MNSYSLVVFLCFLPAGFFPPSFPAFLVSVPVFGEEVLEYIIGSYTELR